MLPPGIPWGNTIQTQSDHVSLCWCNSEEFGLNGGQQMDFVERIFGIAPDGGSGSFEFLLLLIPIIAFYLIYRSRSRKL
jgi:hypothetical protein